MKISKQGGYLPFYGVSVICPLITDISTYYKQFEQDIKDKNINILMLPLNSMHMTLKDFWTERDYKSRKQYEIDLKNKMVYLRKLQDKLSPYKHDTIRMKVSSNYLNGVYLIPASYNDELKILKYEQLLDICLRDIGTFPIIIKHMSFGYHYGDIKKTFEFNKKSLPDILEFKAPTVCSFESMLHYEPI